MEWKAFEQVAEKLRVEEGIPGMAVGIARNGEVLFVNGFGTIDAEGTTKVTPDTVFGTASVTKSFTSLAVHILAAEGKLSVADPVIDHLPEAGTISVLRNATIRHLLSHTTGIPPVKRREELAGFGAHIRYLESLTLNPIGPAGKQISYSNDAFLLLGALIEKVTGTDYKTFIMERIVRPAGMTRTNFVPPAQGAQTNTAVQYTEKLVPADWPELGNYAVGGGIRSTVNDLIRYGRLYTDEEFRLSVLGNVDTGKMHMPVAFVDDQTAYGFGLMVTPDFHGTPLVYHGGGQPGVSSSFAFLPEKGVTIAVLTNRTDVPAERLMKSAVHTVLGQSLDEAVFRLPDYPMSKDELETYTGNYRNDEDPEGFQISRLGSGLELIAGDRTLQLRPVSPGQFQNDWSGKLIRFEVGNRERGAVAFTGLRVYRRAMEETNRVDDPTCISYEKARS